MHVDKIARRLIAIGLAVTISGLSRSTAEDTSSRSDTAQSLPTPSDNSDGNVPTNPAKKEADAQDFPRQAGIGAALRIEDGKVLVSRVLPDSPAARSQLIKTNDQVIAVAEGNGQPIDVRGTKDVARIVGLIRGPIRTVVRLTIVPEGKGETDQLVVNLFRGDIKEINWFVDGRLLPLGSKAPNFKFARLVDAGESDVSQLAGRIVVVDFWASWCGPCMKTVDEMASLQEQHPEWAGQVELLAVSVDERKEDAVTLLKSKHWSKISIVWAGPDVLNQYRVAGLPTMFVIDRAGSIAAVDHRLDVPAVIKRLQSVQKTDSR